jgi:hypothetical protein
MGRCECWVLGSWGYFVQLDSFRVRPDTHHDTSLGFTETLGVIGADEILGTDLLFMFLA